MMNSDTTFDMESGYDAFFKPCIQTPDTAQSIQKNKGFDDFEVQRGNKFFEDNDFLQDNVIPQKEKLKPKRENILKQIKENTVEECSFSVIIYLNEKNKEKQDAFQKNIEKCSEGDEECKLYFKRQHEKKEISLDVIYQIKIFLRGKEGFQKLIWAEDHTFAVKEKNTINKIDSKNFSLSFSIETFKKSFIKILGFSMPISVLPDFFQYKNQLLSKTPELYKIKKLSQLKGIYYELSKQNMGSRVLQKLIERASNSQIQVFISEIREKFGQMILDRYGNYVIQKLFSFSSPQKRNYYLKLIEKKILLLMKSKTGTYTVQFILELLNYSGFQKVYQMIDGYEFLLCTDEYGFHCIKKLLDLSFNYDFIDKIMSSFPDLCCNKYGVIALKKILKIGQFHPQIRTNILFYCQENMKIMCQNEYGHYIIEEIFSYYYEQQLSPILNYCLQNIVEVSTNTYSSSIIKQSLKKLGKSWLNKIILSLIEHWKVKQLMESNYGSFVIHRIIEKIDQSNLRHQFMSSIVQSINSLKSYEKRQKWTLFLKQLI